jgi:hypothetical protein
MIPQATLDGIRAMHAAFHAGLAVVDLGDDEAVAALDVLAGALVGYVPLLLDEIEHLQADEPDRIRSFFKMDRTGGTA